MGLPVTVEGRAVTVNHWHGHVVYRTGRGVTRRKSLPVSAGRPAGPGPAARASAGSPSESGPGHRRAVQAAESRTVMVRLSHRDSESRTAACPGPGRGGLRLGPGGGLGLSLARVQQAVDG